MKTKAISIAVLFLLVLFSHLQNANAQTYPAKLLTEIPESAQILESPDVRERAAILKKLVVPVPQSCTGEQSLPVNLDKQDYEFIVGKILEMDLSTLDYKDDSYIWGKLEYLITRFQMFQHLETLTKYLDHPEKYVQTGIVYAVRGLKAKELDYKLVPLLNSPEKFVREETLQTLIELESKKAVPALIKRLAEPDEYSRRYAAMMNLVKVKGTEAAPYVSNILNDENENNRYWAIDTLVKLDAKTEASKLWKYIEVETNQRFVNYALGALLYFGEKKAVPLAVKNLKDNAVNKGDYSVFEFINTLKPKILIPELTALYYQKEKFFEDTDTERRFRTTVYNILYAYRIRDFIPIYRENLFSFKIWNENYRFSEGVAQILVEINAVEAVDDMIVGLRDRMKNKSSQYYDYEVGNIAYYLAKFGDKKANQILIEVVSENKTYYRGLIIAEMNRQLNPDLWKILDTATLPMISIEPVGTFSEKAAQSSGLKISFEKDPASEKALCQVEDFNFKNGIPCTYSRGGTSLKESLNYLFYDRRNRNYTWIIDNGKIRVLPVEKAIEWWHKNQLPE